MQTVGSSEATLLTYCSPSRPWLGYACITPLEYPWYVCVCVQVPLLNCIPLEQLADGRLVRYRGMIQDQFNPELYLKAYTAVNSSTGHQVPVPYSQSHTPIPILPVPNSQSQTPDSTVLHLRTHRIVSHVLYVRKILDRVCMCFLVYIHCVLLLCALPPCRYNVVDYIEICWSSL